MQALLDDKANAGSPAIQGNASVQGSLVCAAPSGPQTDLPPDSIAAVPDYEQEIPLLQTLGRMQTQSLLVTSDGAAQLLVDPTNGAWVLGDLNVTGAIHPSVPGPTGAEGPRPSWADGPHRPHRPNRPDRPYRCHRCRRSCRHRWHR